MKLQLAEIATSTLVTVHPTDSLTEAYKKMTGIRHLPVVDDHGNIVGIITDRDFNRAALFDISNLKPLKFKEWATVADFMSWPVTSVTAQTPFLKVVETMISKKISCVLVTDQDKLTGIVTTENLMFVLAEMLKQKRSFREQIYEKLNDWTYHTPIGQILTLLADSGV